MTDVIYRSRSALIQFIASNHTNVNTGENFNIVDDLVVDGNITANKNLTVSNDLIARGEVNFPGSVIIEGEIASNTLITGDLTVSGDTTFGNALSDKVNVAGSLTVGNAYTLPVTDGTANQVLTTDGNGNVSFQAPIDDTAGDVSKTGTPLNSQIAVWTNASTIEGTDNLTFDGSSLTIGGDLTVSGNDIKSSTATAIALAGADVTIAGDLIVGGGDIQGPTDGTLVIRSDQDIGLHLDDDGGSTSYFKLYKDDDQLVFSVDESGNGTFVGKLTIGGGLAGFGTPYALPMLDGTANQVLTTDGNGQVSFRTPAAGGGGDVSKAGTPSDNHIAVWTNASTIEGTSDLTYDGTMLTIAGDLTVGDSDIYGGTDGPLRLKADTNMYFDVDQDESNPVGGNRWYWRTKVNGTNTSIMNLDESGDLIVEGIFQVKGDSIKSNAGPTIQFSSATEIELSDDLKVVGDIDTTNLSAQGVQLGLVTSYIKDQSGTNRIVVQSGGHVGFVDSSGSAAFTVFDTYAKTAGNLRVGANLQCNGDPSTQMTLASGFIQFFAKGVDLLELTQTGVGIRGATPIAGLAVTGDIEASGDLTIAGALTVSNAYTLPATDGTADQVLTTDGKGNISFQSAAGGGGDVSKAGTPSDNQIAVWTNASTIEGTSDLTYDGSTLLLSDSAPKFIVRDTTANYQITLMDSSGPQVRFGDSDTFDDAFMTFGAYSGINRLDTKGRDFHLYGTNNSTGLYFNQTDGRFGIKRTNPAYVLDVAGTFRCTSAMYANTTLDVTGDLSVGGDITANKVTAPLVGNATTATTATNAKKLEVTNRTLNAAYPILISGDTTPDGGYEDIYANAGVTLNPGTSTITATTFAGNASTATRANTINTTATSTNSNHYLTFVDTSGGQIGETLRVDSGLKYNPSTNNLTISGDAYVTDELTVAGDVIKTSGLATALQFDASGRVTKPNNPAFSARGTNEQSISAATWTKIEFDTKNYDTETNFSNSNDQFTAPVTGKYILSTQVRLAGVDSSSGQYVWIKIVTSNRNYYHLDATRYYASNLYATPSLTVVADMDAGDIAYVQVLVKIGTTNTQGSSGANYTAFQGALLG